MEDKMSLGADVSAPITHVTLGDKDYKVKFDMMAFRIAEDVYYEHYHREANFGQIIVELSHGRLGAMMAALYGAVMQGGEAMIPGPDGRLQPMDWDTFAQKFSLVSIPGVRDLLMEQITKALPEVSDKDQREAEAALQDPPQAVP